jgi:hypothetical protein
MKVQLMLWPHFWRSAEKGKYYRDAFTEIIVDHVIVGYRTNMEDFRAKLESLGPVELREEHCDFKEIPMLCTYSDWMHTIAGQEQID